MEGRRRGGGGGEEDGGEEEEVDNTGSEEGYAGVGGVLKYKVKQLQLQ